MNIVFLFLYKFSKSMFWALIKDILMSTQKICLILSYLLNPFMLSGLFFHNSLDWSISNSVWLFTIATALKQAGANYGSLSAGGFSIGVNIQCSVCVFSSVSQIPRLLG